MQDFQQLPANGVVPACQYDHELISTRAVDRTVLEDVADHHGSLANILVAGLVAKGVVDLL